MDPNANCTENQYSYLDLPNCSGDLETVGDGGCDVDNNNKARVYKKSVDMPSRFIFGKRHGVISTLANINTVIL